MVQLVSRAVGAVIVLGFAAMGAGSTVGKILKWKRVYDANPSGRTVSQ